MNQLDRRLLVSRLFYIINLVANIIGVDNFVRDDQRLKDGELSWDLNGPPPYFLYLLLIYSLGHSDLLDHSFLMPCRTAID
jgi:hypothetical protein